MAPGERLLLLCFVVYISIRGRRQGSRPDILLLDATSGARPPLCIVAMGDKALALEDTFSMAYVILKISFSNDSSTKQEGNDIVDKLFDKNNSTN